MTHPLTLPSAYVHTRTRPLRALPLPPRRLRPRPRICHHRYRYYYRYYVGTSGCFEIHHHYCMASAAAVACRRHSPTRATLHLRALHPVWHWPISCAPMPKPCWGGTVLKEWDLDIYAEFDYTTGEGSNRLLITLRVTLSSGCSTIASRGQTTKDPRRLTSQYIKIRPRPGFAWSIHKR